MEYNIQSIIIVFVCLKISLYYIPNINEFYLEYNNNESFLYFGFIHY